MGTSPGGDPDGEKQASHSGLNVKLFSIKNGIAKLQTKILGGDLSPYSRIYRESDRRAVN
jgi:hypothetical protein